MSRHHTDVDQIISSTTPIALASFMHLPPDLRKILLPRFLRVWDLLHLCSTSREFAELGRRPSLWRALIQRDFCIDYKGVHPKTVYFLFYRTVQPSLDSLHELTSLMWEQSEGEDRRSESPFRELGEARRSESPFRELGEDRRSESPCPPSRGLGEEPVNMSILDLLSAFPVIRLFKAVMVMGWHDRICIAYRLRRGTLLTIEYDVPDASLPPEHDVVRHSLQDLKIYVSLREAHGLCESPVFQVQFVTTVTHLPVSILVNLMWRYLEHSRKELCLKPDIHQQLMKPIIQRLELFPGRHPITHAERYANTECRLWATVNMTVLKKTHPKWYRERRRQQKYRTFRSKIKRLELPRFLKGTIGQFRNCAVM